MINLDYDTLNQDIVIGLGLHCLIGKNKKGFMMDDGQEIIHNRILSRLYDRVAPSKGHGHNLVRVMILERIYNGFPERVIYYCFIFISISRYASLF